MGDAIAGDLDNSNQPYEIKKVDQAVPNSPEPHISQQPEGSPQAAQSPEENDNPEEDGKLLEYILAKINETEVFFAHFFKN